MVQKAKLHRRSCSHHARGLTAHHLVLAIRRFGILRCNYHLESSRAFPVSNKASGLTVIDVPELEADLIRLHTREGMKIARATGKLSDK